MSDLRRWQHEALRRFSLWTPTTENGFLIEATPGAGKTRVSIEIAHRLMESGRISRIVVAVPTARLESQWAEEFDRHGINVNAGWHAAIGALAKDEDGVAATYAEIANSPQSFRRLAGQERTLVILDEIHHCGETKAWGEGIREAFGPAAVRLMLSGTPFRSDDNEIPFVRYVDGAGAPDFRYGYADALGDEIVRSVFFPRRGGRMEWRYGEDRKSATFDEELRERDAGRRLRTAVHVDGEWVQSVLAEADQKLAELRQVDPDAGGIVFCDDSNAARGIHAQLDPLAQGHAVLAITDEPEADERIKNFRESRTPWIVSIRKVSEGVDIPRLRVGVYATPWTTEMFFRQVVGRMVRVRADEEDRSAWLYIPDDPRLRQMAEQIKVARDHVLEQKAQELLGGDGGGEGGSSSLFTPVSSSAVDLGTISDTTTYSPEELANAERVKREAGVAGVATPVVAGILRHAGSAPQQVSESPRPKQRQEDRKERLRRANNSAARRVANDWAVDHKVVNGALNGAVGVPTLKAASEEQLNHRLELAQRWLRTGQRPVE